MNETDTVVEYRESFNKALSTDSPYKVGHRVRLSDGEVEWDDELFSVRVNGGTLQVYTKPLYEAWNGKDTCTLVAALSPTAWLRYDKVDYTV